MIREYEPKQSRANTYIKFFPEKYLWGSTKTELLPDERSVWLDFLCLGSMNFGVIEVYSRDQLAQQLMISRELLDRSCEKFIKYDKIKRRYNKKKKKEIFKIVNWSRYQADYLTKRVKKSSTYGEKERIIKKRNPGAGSKPILKERGGEETKTEERILEETREKDPKNPETPNSFYPENSSPLRPSPYEENKEITKKEQFLSMLRNCEGYPFDPMKDSLLFDFSVIEYPEINILKQTEKKIAWWEDHPDSLKAKPREKLKEWFKDEFKFIKRGGPQKVGDILPEFKDSDHRKFIMQLTEDS